MDEFGMKRICGYKYGDFLARNIGNSCIRGHTSSFHNIACPEPRRAYQEELASQYLFRRCYEHSPIGFKLDQLPTTNNCDG